MAEQAAPLPAGAEPEKKKRTFTFPTAFTILFILLVVVALLTWIVPAGTYVYKDGAPDPGHLPHGAGQPAEAAEQRAHGADQRHVRHRGRDGNVDVWNSGELFGAIDVAMFVLIIGGFLGVTMKTGAINAGIAWVVSKLKGKEKWMFPILMTIFAIGGTTYGMAEETLAFYALIITVMLAAGYDGLSRGRPDPAGRRHRRARLDHQPLRHRHRLGLRRDDHQRGTDRPAGASWSSARSIGILFVMRYAERVKKDPTKSLIYDQKAENEKQFMSGGRRRHGLRQVHRPAQGDPGPVLPGLRRHGLRRDPLGGPGPADPHLVVVVPGDDGLLPVLRHPDRHHRPAAGEGAGRHLRRRRPGHAGRGADHRRGPRHHRDHEQRPDHRHRAVLGGAGASPG